METCHMLLVCSHWLLFKAVLRATFVLRDFIGMPQIISFFEYQGYLTIEQMRSCHIDLFSPSDAQVFCIGCIGLPKPLQKKQGPLSRELFKIHHDFALEIALLGNLEVMMILGDNDLFDPFVDATLFLEGIELAFGK